MVESMAAAPTGTGQHEPPEPPAPRRVDALGRGGGRRAGAVAVQRSRPELGVAAAATVVGANVTTQALKRWLDRPDLLGLGGANSFPSGHVTVVASLAAGALLVSVRRASPPSRSPALRPRR